jgi:hypothetical protein
LAAWRTEAWISVVVDMVGEGRGRERERERQEERFGPLVSDEILRGENTLPICYRSG